MLMPANLRVIITILAGFCFLAALASQNSPPTTVADLPKASLSLHRALRWGYGEELRDNNPLQTGVADVQFGLHAILRFQNVTRAAIPRLKGYFGDAFRWDVENGDGGQEWPDLSFGWRTGVAVVLGAVGSFLASMGGIGGGGLFVPIFNLLLEFDSKTSTALSNFMIFGGSLANLAWYSLQKNPQFRERPLIDYDVALIVQPNLLLGISLGVICNIAFPVWVITVMLILTLSSMSIRSFQGAIHLWRCESAVNRVSNKINTAAKGRTTNCLPFGRNTEECAMRCVKPTELPEDSNVSKTNVAKWRVCISDAETKPTYDAVLCKLPAEREVSACASTDGCLDSVSSFPEVEEQGKTRLLGPRMNSQMRQFPSGKLAMLVLIWFSFFTVQILRGSKSGKSILNLKACGTGYWIATIMQVPIPITLTALVAYRLRGYSQLHAVPLLHESWNVFSLRAFTALSALALLAGLLGGMLGIGGGMIMNPLFLEIGMSPQVTAATCAFLVFFSSSMSVIQFWLLGRIPVRYALVCAALCLICSVAGLQVVRKVIERSGRVSLIVFSVSCMLGISAIFMACFGTMNMWRLFKDGGYVGFHSPC